MAGRETGKAPAMVPAGWLPRRSRSRTARRVGSASAWKVASEEYVTERFRIMRNLTVTRRRCQARSSAWQGSYTMVQCKNELSDHNCKHKRAIRDSFRNPFRPRDQGGNADCRNV